MSLPAVKTQSDIAANQCNAQHSCKYKTKTANSIAYIIGQTDEVQALDDLRIKIKSMKGKKNGHLTELGRKHQHLLAFLKTKVKKRSEELDKTLKDKAMKVLVDIEQ